ncbi:hypothetical protein EJ110_NYTH12816 [Nymphaea thermarum]|nr:hypothetical protein EJ110_NYTH12816 [Nymphaea thermarum]
MMLGMLKSIVKNLRKKLISRSKKNVKEGHFAVLAICEEKAKRFVLPLSYLSNPAFLRLLDEAEEYGFQQKGILTVLCRPGKVESILAGGCRK